MSARRRSAGTAVSTTSAVPVVAGGSGGGAGGSAMEARSRSWAARSVAVTSATIPSTSSPAITPASTSRPAYTSRTVGWWSIRSTISGCVYAASSCSLWPKRR